MKNTALFLFILWPLTAILGQDSLETPFPEACLGERLTAFLLKNPDAVFQGNPSFLLPENLSTTGMAEYRISQEMKNGAGVSIYFFYRKKAVILISCYQTDRGTDIFTSLKKKYGHYSSRTIYKGPDFNRSGCPTQEVTYWVLKNQAFYFIYMPEFHRCQFILADTKVQDRLNTKKTKPF